MMKLEKAWLDFLREQYPTGSRIELHEMADDPDPLPSGSTGTLNFIDDTGTFHVAWDNGRDLGLVIGQDRFAVRPPELTPLKLYMPLAADLYGYDDWGNMENDSVPLDGRELREYTDTISARLLKYRAPEEAERGLMHWYRARDGLNDKVRSAFFAVEERDGQLWGVAECRVCGELTPAELHDLKEYIGGQASDGWGEGFEQQAINVSGGEMYVHLWNCEDWGILTEQETFGPEIAPPQMGGPALG